MCVSRALAAHGDEFCRSHVQIHVCVRIREYLNKACAAAACSEPVLQQNFCFCGSPANISSAATDCDK